MRSYRDRNVKNISGGAVEPVASWFQSLRGSTHRLTRPEPYIEDKIIKINMYKKSKARMESMNRMPGDSLQIVRVIGEITLSTFTFQTHNQYKSWLAQASRLKAKYGQKYEVYFSSNGGQTIDYKKMIRTLNHQITHGEFH